jgi:hypothetical protein
MIKFIKRLFKREPQPDVLVVGPSGGIRLYVSRVVGSRRIVENCGEVFLLNEDGTVRGSYWATTWEPL